MITIEKTQGVQTTDQLTCVRIQEIILAYKQQHPIGKVVIDAEKITFYKFGLKLGFSFCAKTIPFAIAPDRHIAATLVIDFTDESN